MTTQQPVSVGSRLTIYDLGYFPNDGTRYEVIDGEIYATPPPHSDHQQYISNISFAMYLWDPEKRRGWMQVGTGIVFDAETGVIPDLLWISRERFRATLINPATGIRDGQLHSAPDLVIEVLSDGQTGSSRDREIKLGLYSRRGVREYWIVDGFTRTIEIYRRGSDAGLAHEVTLNQNETVSTSLLPGFFMPVADVFALPSWLDQELG